MIPAARPEVLALRHSKIREVANAGFGRTDVLPFWFGETDQPTPAFIREAAAQALSDGRTYYVHNLGTAELRGALSGYLSGLHGRAIGEDRIAVTSSGVSAVSSPIAVLNRPAAAMAPSSAAALFSRASATSAA